MFRDLKGRTPYLLREDFCGTFAVCCEWVKLGPRYTAHGRDMDPEPTRYGSTHYLPKLSAAQRGRVKISNQDVLEPGRPPCDLLMAMNFSYGIFKERGILKRYFMNCFKSLRPGGVMALDAFGGAGMQKANKETTKHAGFTYYWEQLDFDPLTNTARCAMHFKPKGRKKVKNVFTYDFRIWSLMELRELLAEAGFRKTHVYWEKSGTARDNIWIALILAEK